MRYKELKQLKESFTVSEPKGLRGPAVADIQKALKALGFSVGPMGVDGIMGPYTEKGIKDFQTAAKMPTITGHPDQETVAHINKTLTANPEAAASLTPSTDADVKGRKSAANVDVSAIQDPDFKVKLENIAQKLGTTSNAMLAVMKLESGVNPHIQNSIGATGLIQFMPKTAIALGTTTNELAKMDAVKQLDYVYKYYKMTGVGDGSAGDLYMATFMPKYVGADDSKVLGRQGAEGRSGKVYAQNAVLDKNRDGVITVADVKQSVQRFA